MTGRRQRINVQNHCPCPWPFYRTSNSRAPWGGQCGLCCDCITTQHLPDTCSSPKLSQQSSHTGMLFQGLFFRILICNHPYSSFWPVVLEKTLESPLDFKDIKPVNLKGNQPWIFIGRTDAEAEALILWLLDAKSRLIRKEPDSGKDWWQEEKETTEGWMAPPTQQTWAWASSGRLWRTGKPGVAKSRTRLSDWTTTSLQDGVGSRVVRFSK